MRKGLCIALVLTILLSVSLVAAGAGYAEDGYTMSLFHNYSNTASPSLSSEGGVFSVSGKLKDGQTVLVLDEVLSIDSRVRFDMRVNYDYNGVTTAAQNGAEIYEWHNYFTLYFQQQGNPGDPLGAEDFVFNRSGAAPNGMQFKVCYAEAWKTWSDRVNLYDFSASGTQIDRGLTISTTTAREDFSAAFNSGATVSVEIGKEYYEGVLQMYFKFTTYLRQGASEATSFRVPYSAVKGGGDGKDFYLALGLTNTIAEHESNVDIKVSDIVTEDVSGSMNKAELFMEPDDEETLTADFGSLTGDAVWSSGDESVAAVDASGKVTAVSKGVTKIKASIGRVFAESTVYVIKSVSVSKRELTLAAGRKYNMSAVSDPAGILLVWFSTDTEVAEVAGGVITAKRAGSCQIKAAAGAIAGVCELTVTDYAQPENVYAEKYSVLYSDGASGASNLIDTTYGYAVSGSISDGYSVFAVNAGVDLTKAYTFDVTLKGDSSYAYLSGAEYLKKYFGIYINQANPADGKLSASDFAAFASGSSGVNGAQLKLHYVYDWMHVGIGYNRGMYYTQSAGGWSQSNTLESKPEAGGGQYGSALAMTFNAGGLKVKVRIAVEGDNLVIALTPYTAAGDLAQSGTFPGYTDAPYGTCAFSYPMSRVVSDAAAAGGYYVGFVFGNTLEGAENALDYRIDNINTAAVEGLEIDTQSVFVVNGAAQRIIGTVLPRGIEGQKIKWVSSDDTVAQVDQSGNVTAFGKGTAVITASVGGYSKVCAVTVIGGVTMVKPSGGYFLFGDGTLSLSAASDPAGAELKWSSGDIRIATVDKNGTVVFKKTGIVVITVRYGDFSDEFTLTITDELPEEGGGSGCGCSGKVVYGTAAGAAFIAVTAGIFLIYKRNLLSKVK